MKRIVERYILQEILYYKRFHHEVDMPKDIINTKMIDILKGNILTIDMFHKIEKIFDLPIIPYRFTPDGLFLIMTPLELIEYVTSDRINHLTKKQVEDNYEYMKNFLPSTIIYSPLYQAATKHVNYIKNFESRDI